MILGTNSVLVVGVMATSALLFANGCGKKTHVDDVSTTEITSETLVRGTISGAARDSRGEYVRMAHGDLNNLDRRIALLEEQAAGTGAAAGVRTTKELRDMHTKVRALRLRLDDVPTMQAAVWTQEQTHLQSDWDVLCDRVERIGEQLSARP